jgi:hypothetical protein
MRERVQVPDGQGPVPLRPAGIPSDTYVAPQSDPLLRLSQTLGELRPALGNFGAAYLAHKNQKAQEELQATTPLMSNREVHDAYSNGQLPGMSAPESFADIASRKLAGARAAYEVQESVKAELAKGGFDWEKGNINDFVYERMKARSAEFGQDRYALGGFGETMTGFPEKLATLRTTEATAIDQVKRQDNTFQAISLAVDKAKSDGKSDEEAVQAARGALLSTAGPNGSQGVPFAEADKYVLQKAAQLVADGRNLDTAVALLTTERVGQNDEKLPALKDTAQHQETIRSILKSAKSERARQAELAALEAIVTTDANMVATESGKLATISDVTYRKEDGTAKTVSAKERRDDAVREYISTTSPTIAKANRETPQQTFNRELSNLSFAGAEHPKWKAALEAAPLAASINELTNPQKRDVFLGSANLYDQLREKNPLYLKGLVDPKTVKFFEAYRVAKALPGKTMEEAADLARRSAIDISPDHEDILKGHYQKIERDIRLADPRAWWQFIVPKGLGGEVPPVNTGYAQQQVIEFAKLFTRLGLAPTDSIQEAQKAFRDTSTVVNGWIVPSIPGLPKDFPVAASAYMKDFVSKFGKLNEGVSESNIGVVHDGAGVFSLVGPNGAGLRTPTGIAHFTLRDLGAFAKNTDDKLRADLLSAADAKAQARVPGKDPATDAILNEYATATQRYEHYLQLSRRARKVNP